jgi:DNA-binding transcriptional LysR family regulator
MNYSLDEMAVFVEVVDSGNFSSAAKKSGIPVSTISRRISDLETRLNVQLLYRTTRQQRLTDIGTVYYEHCSRMLSEAEGAELAVQNLQAQPSGVLRITSPYAYEDSFMSELMASFIEKYPQVKLQNLVNQRKVDLIEEKIDCAVIAGRLDDSSLVKRGLGTASVVYCCSPGYIEKYGLPKQLDKLDGHKLVHLEIPEWLNPEPEILEELVETRLTTNDMFMCRQAAIDSLGIARLPRVHIAKALEKGELIEVLPEHVIALPLSILFPSNKQFTTKLRAFIDHMVEFSAKHAKWDFD